MEGRTRAQALNVCGQVLLPLARVLITWGISAPEFTNACKQVFVQAAADRLARSGKRLNRSRIAIVTGLTRAEVTKILETRASTTRTLPSQLHRARRVIAGWCSDAEFASREGRPRALLLRGRRASFESLVKRYSGDIPTRAMLDELLAMSAVAKQKDGRVRLSLQEKASPIGARELDLLGNQGHALFDTLCHKLQDPNNPLFLDTVVGRKLDSELLQLLLQRIQTQGREFLSRIDDQFKHPPRVHRGRRTAESNTLGVTVFTYRNVLGRTNRHR